jgi:hypothetical protein
MSRILQKAFDEISTLPQKDRDEMGERLLKWRRLRAEIDLARDQVTAGDVASLDAEAIIRKARASYGKS